MDLQVRQLAAADLDGADRVLRSAFIAFHGADLLADTDLLRTRFRARHTTVLGVGPQGSPLASVVVTGWGSVGLLGPISVDPPMWGRGLGSMMLAAAVELLDRWGATHQGLFTFASSPRHHALYQRFGFWPRFLTAIMSIAVTGEETWPSRRLSAAVGQRLGLVAECAEITEAIRPGLDLRGEIDAVLDLDLGDVVLVGDTRPDGFAICHAGAGTEAGTGIAYVKFAAVRPGANAATTFAALLDACRGYAAQVGAERLTLGVNTARHEAYRMLVAAGLRTDVAGVTMHRPNAPGYDTPDTYVLDDWR
jgi:GNAT superfamily N-acetyltransferase